MLSEDSQLDTVKLRMPAWHGVSCSCMRQRTLNGVNEFMIWIRSLTNSTSLHESAIERLIESVQQQQSLGCHERLDDGHTHS